jgi:hypothetical protein
MLGCHGVGAATPSMIRPSRDASKILVCRAATSKIRPSPPMRQHIFQPRPCQKQRPSSGELMPSGLEYHGGGPRDILSPTSAP